MNTKTLFYITAAVVFIPFVGLNFYNFPSADDFWYAKSVFENGFFGAQIDFYEKWSGRFIATALMSFNPITTHSLWGYKLYSLCNQLLFAACLFVLVQNIMQRLGQKNYSTLLWLGLLLTFTIHLPSPSEGWYWMAGYINYTFPLSALMLLSGIYINRIGCQFSGLSVFAMIALSIFVVGSNETLMFQLCCFWLAAFIIDVFWTKRHRLVHFSLLSLSGLAAIAVALAPGNFVRASRFTQIHPVVAPFSSLNSVLEHTVQFISVPLLAGLLLLALFILKHPDIHASLKQKMAFVLAWKTRYLVALYFMVLALGFYPSHVSMGGNPRARVDNMFYLIYLFFWLLIIVQSVLRHPEGWQIFFKKRQSYLNQKTLALVFCGFCIAWDNTVIAWYDLLWSGPQYHSQTRQRLHKLQSKKGQKVFLAPLQHSPHTIVFKDFYKDSDNSNAAFFFDVQQIRIKNE